MTFGETSAGVIVDQVEPGGAAAKLSVPVGGLLLAVNALPLSGMSKFAVQKMISKANWPMTLQIAPLMNFEFERPPVVPKKKYVIPKLGLVVGDSQNGVIVLKVAETSQAHERGVPVGGLFVTVNDTSVAGLGKAEIDGMLKERPLTLQIAPREAAYLFRPRGIYARGGASPRGGVSVQQPAANSSQQQQPAAAAGKQTPSSKAAASPSTASKAAASPSTAGKAAASPQARSTPAPRSARRSAEVSA